MCHQFLNYNLIALVCKFLYFCKLFLSVGFLQCLPELNFLLNGELEMKKKKKPIINSVKLKDVREGCLGDSVS